MSKKYQIFNEPSALTSVAAFHDVFHLPVLNKPTIPNEKRCALRISLLQEELDELKSAILENDIVAAADAFCDLQYVLSGAILEFGLGNKFKDLFDEVQRSNMSKPCHTYEDALETQKYYLSEKSTDSFIEEQEGQYLVYRTTDKKVLKSIRYSEANLDKIIFNSE